MNSIRLILVAVAFSTAVFTTRPGCAQKALVQAGDPATEPTPEEDLEFANRLGGLVKRVARRGTPSVVHIDAEKEEKKQGRSEEFEEAGSGVIIQIGGQMVIVTNRHVIHGAPHHRIRLRFSDGREVHPIKVIEDKATDVAIMRVETLDLVPAPVGDSTKMEIGDLVVAIGSPFGLSHSVTFGIISAMGRRSLKLGEQEIDIQDFFQTDAAINPGNSGGPLFNMRGEVVGLNTAIASSGGGNEGIGFAIPMKLVMHVAQQLVQFGQSKRGFLGVTLDPDFDAADAKVLGLTKLVGARIKQIESNSPASRAGFQLNDVVIAFDNIPVDDDDHLVALVGLTEVERPAPVVVYRQGKQFQVNVTLTLRNN